MKKVLYLILTSVLLVFLSGCSNEDIREEEFNLEVEGGTIYGTLTLPKDGDTFKVAIIHQGSGPTDRDGNSHIGGSNNSLKMIATELANHGIASVRYDKRGIAESMSLVQREEDLVFEDYINDLNLWIDRVRGDERFEEIYLIGHSEGALIASVSATEGEVNGFISLAGAGYSAYDTLVRQLSSQPKEIRDELFPIMDELLKGELVKNIDPMYASLFRESVQPYLISWFKYDPIEIYSRIEEPIIIIQGDNDLQITLEDASRLAESINQEPIIVEGMNHVLKDAPRDYEENLKTYQLPNLELHPQLVEEIVEFIIEN